MDETLTKPTTAGTGLARAQFTLRILAAVFFVGAGVNHFRNAGFYERIVPPSFPSPHILVAISGVAEIVGGFGLLIRPLRRWAGWGLIALLVAVFPANLYMAMEPDKFADLHLPGWTFLARLPLQAVIIAWVWFVSLGRATLGPRSA
jgi:uncharacterized membrane protein